MVDVFKLIAWKASVLIILTQSFYGEVVIILSYLFMFIWCYSSLNELIHVINLSVFTDSMAIGINLWFAPQISEHCP